MASQIKHKVAKNFYDVLQSKINVGNFTDFIGCINLLRTKTNKIIWRIRLPPQCDDSFDSNFFCNSQEEFLKNKIIKKIVFNNVLNLNNLDIELDVKYFIKDILDSNPTKLNCKSSPKKIIVEFSSPNIAKPFHMGHLRSTIIGNCLANIKRKFGHDVIKMNYLGDWGTQFGMIQLGMKLENYSEEDLKKNPFKVLLNAYIKGNAEAEKNQELYEQAKKVFYDLESEKEEITQLWSKYRNWTIEQLSPVYKRLGVVFDEYCWESDYRRNKMNYILKMLEEEGILSEDEKGRKVAVINERKIPLLKSDDTTLYLLRDLKAVMDRRSKYSFDEMYYVVENGQSEHFKGLLTLCSKLKIDEGVKLEHVKFGRVTNMSTRKGKIIFLSEVLDEAREILYEKQRNSNSKSGGKFSDTKVSLETKDNADILGVSSVIISDLKQSRLKDYEFSWENSLRLKGNTGICMQYCHCRLFNLENNSECAPASDCDPEALLEPEAINLILTLARYEQNLWNTNKSLEPCILVTYISDLVRAINIAYKHLIVKDNDSHVASQRLLMFKKSREVLNESLTLLGIHPLTQM